ncbi:hypothetical protein Taro_028849 [Colocasia esculenta]|uniref:TCP domain-containing protein n=1 Tax=Colocasia esculenta TaxID=4460 RepID=A0A843VJN8_COLES|nr:hypothetical protein [Colocasia esculenta]
MGESHRYHPHHLYGHQLLHPAPHGRPPAHHSRLGSVRGGGEIVEVQGGHILRSIGRKDRHSKVFTAKGPRDRRVRLSAHTAIQFYDVQDRLGYDRPSKAVDWLIKNAKAAIDELAELPPCRPVVPGAAAASGSLRGGDQEDPEGEASGAAEEPGEKPLTEAEAVASSTYGFATNSFLPPSLDSDAIADTIKSFFPMAAVTTGASSSPAIGFQTYPPELLPRGGGQAQDLRLSLQSFQDPVLLQQQQHHHHHPQPTTAHHHHHQTSAAAEQALFSSSSTHLPFESSSAGWSELSQRMFSWNAPAETGGGGSGGGYILVPPQQQAVPLHTVLGQSPFLSQRGPLQSSNSPNVRAWTDPSAAEESVALPPGPPFGFVPGSFSGFRIPARIQGEEEHDGVHKKPSSASSASRH